MATGYVLTYEFSGNPFGPAGTTTELGPGTVTPVTITTSGSSFVWGYSTHASDINALDGEDVTGYTSIGGTSSTASLNDSLFSLNMNLDGTVSPLPQSAGDDDAASETFGMYITKTGTGADETYYLVMFEDGYMSMDPAFYNGDFGAPVSVTLNSNVAETTTTEGETFSGSIAATPEEVTVPPAPVCFTGDMLVQTPRGEVRMDQLAIGDLVMTSMGEALPIRYMYKRKMASVGTQRPIIFDKGAIGNSEVVMVSQKHRFLIATLPEDVRKSVGINGALPALIEADRLLNGSTIRIDTSGGNVEYFHLMFDKHTLLNVHGTVSESWQPHRRNLRRDKQTRDELMHFFPEIKLQEKASVNGKPVAPTLWSIPHGLAMRVNA